MTAEEAIRFQEAYYVIANGKKAQQACEMAIEALEKQIPKECVVDSFPDHTQL